MALWPSFSTKVLRFYVTFESYGNVGMYIYAYKYDNKRILACVIYM